MATIDCSTKRLTHYACASPPFIDQLRQIFTNFGHPKSRRYLTERKFSVAATNTIRRIFIFTNKMIYGIAVFICFAFISADSLGSSHALTSSALNKETKELEDELRLLPTESTAHSEIVLPDIAELNGGLERPNVSTTGPGHHSDGQPELNVESEAESGEEDDDDDEDEDSEEDEDDAPVETPETDVTDSTNIATSPNNVDQMEAIEEDEFYEAKMNSDKSGNAEEMKGEVLDEELELEKRMSRATEKFISTGQLDEATVEELVEMLIRFAGDPEQWERIRQILEKIRYEQISSKKSKARLMALNTLNQPHAEGLKSKNVNTHVTIVSEAQNGLLHKPHRKFNQKNNNVKTMLVGATNKTKSAVKSKPKLLQSHGHTDGQLGRKLTEVESSYKYAVEKPVAVVGERSKPKQLPKPMEPPMSQSLKAIQMEKSRLLSSNDDMEDELKTLVKMERRLKDHLKRKQKLLQQIRESNAKIERHN